MAREPVTQYVILGLLTTWGPLSGYDIKREVETSVGMFWAVSYGQIYPTLKRLTAAGLVTKSIEDQVGRPDRHSYEITEAGIQDLQRWLAEPVRDEDRPEGLVQLKLFFGGNTSVETCMQHVRHFRTLMEKRLASAETLEDRLRTEYANKPDLPYWLFTVHNAQLHQRARIAWCDETLRELERMLRAKPQKGTRTARPRRQRS